MQIKISSFRYVYNPTTKFQVLFNSNVVSFSLRRANWPNQGLHCLVQVQEEIRHTTHLRLQD
jgi:hypothetical protein